MTSPQLAVILRRLYALVAATVLPAGALLLCTGRGDWAFSLFFGAAVALLNAVNLARRVVRAGSLPVAGALRTMQAGMAIRFSMVLLATLVIVKIEPATVLGFAFAMLYTMALGVAVGGRELLRLAHMPQASAQWADGATTGAIASDRMTQAGNAPLVTIVSDLATARSQHRIEDVAVSSPGVATGIPTRRSHQL